MLSKARVALALGLPNIANAVSYRLAVKIGLNPVHRLTAVPPKAPFFLPVAQSAIDLPIVTSWQHSMHMFDHRFYSTGEAIPDWFSNPLNGKCVQQSDKEWFQIPDFDLDVGDIKTVWEFSRLNWVLAFAQRARKNNGTELHKLNSWLVDWCEHNVPYKGPNWKCGQEASIRVMHLAMAALILEQVDSPTRGLRDLIMVHLWRIAPTIRYAMAQDNNHGTSEAAALFVGGSWLSSLGVDKGAEWERVGRHWLENRARRLIGEQGSFSQYSLNYHRMMLDTFCIVEIWRRKLQRPVMSSIWYDRTRAATEWLRHMINPSNGDGPNVGANDGARILQLTDTPYRDYRPTVQMAMVLFYGKRAFKPGVWDNALRWMGITPPTDMALEATDYLADDGGFAILRRGQCMAMLRYPRFRFRPSQADALHLDFWLKGVNVLRDAGTYSYNIAPQWMAYFGGTASHNTVQFDNRDQMPRLSRFLLGSWLKTSYFEPLNSNDVETRFAAGYIDAKGASHHRHVTLKSDSLLIMDEVEGFSQKAVLRWRFMPGDWHIDDSSNTCISVTQQDGGSLQLVVRSSVHIVGAKIIEGWESRCYMEKTTLPVLEIEVHQPAKLKTELRWSK